MADETTETTPETEIAATEPVTETAPETEKKPHPLEPGGPRFNEVYAEKKALEREVAVLREQMARQDTPAAPAKPAPPTYTQDQLQALLDQGRITPAQMAGQLALQAKEMAKQELKQELVHDSKRNSALSEVNDYLKQIPALDNTASPEFAKVRSIAYELAEEWGVDVRDPRVQRRALREAFGTLDTLTKVRRARDYDREHADTYAGTGGGGGRATPAKDPLKAIPKPQRDYWESKGYTPEEQAEMAKYYRPKRRWGA